LLVLMTWAVHTLSFGSMVFSTEVRQEWLVGQQGCRAGNARDLAVEPAQVCLQPYDIQHN